MSNPQINIVVPLYNEEDVFNNLTERFESLIEKISLSIEIIMVDDGSEDNTPELMREYSLNNENFTSVFLSRNFGHQMALTAGLSFVNASEAVLIIDGDLQDPPELLEEFYSYYKKGYDVVYAVREKRKESFIKRKSYNYFYRLLKKISYIDMPLDTGDFSLISRRIVDQLNKMPEESRFIRGMRSWLGFKQIGIPYERQERYSGESKYTFKKLLSLAFNGIFNFSEYPVKIMTRIGLITVIISMTYLLYVIYMRLFYDTVPSGFTALLVVIVLMGGFQLIAMGLIGEYILRIFFQVKNRPLFIVKDVIRKQT